MPRKKSLSLKAFWEIVEQRLTSYSADELRTILRTIAQDLPSQDRQAFLDRLKPPEAVPTGLEAALGQELLLSDIDHVIQDIQVEMEDPDDWHGEDWYDDEDRLGPYERFVTPLTALIERAAAVFDNGDMTLARAAFNKLFEVLDLEDDYGRGVGINDLPSLDIQEILARYLRAVYETEPIEQRVQILLAQWQRMQSLSFEACPRLSDIIEISPKPLPDSEQFFADWIACLKTQNRREADAWLREAIGLAQGTQGLKDLALAEGTKRPRAYLDWFSRLAAEGKDDEIVTAAQDALRTLPNTMTIRANIADYLYNASLRLNDDATARAARWEAFLAQPILTRLLDVWASYPAGPERRQRMQDAAQHIGTYLKQQAEQEEGDAWEASDEHDDWVDDVGSAMWGENAVQAHALLLASDWEAAHQLVAHEEVLGWRSGHNPQGLVIACFLVKLSHESLATLPPNLKALWQEALDQSVIFGFWENTGDIDMLTRLQQCYAECLPLVTWSLAQQASALSWCLDTVRQRVIAIVSQQRRNSYDQAAVLLAAAAEVLYRQGRAEEARALLADMRQRFSRHRAFQTELKSAEQRIEGRLP